MLLINNDSKITNNTAFQTILSVLHKNWLWICSKIHQAVYFILYFTINNEILNYLNVINEIEIE